MADKLAKIRRKFVDKVSIAVLNQLLDDILEDRIVNDGEKDSILEENRSKENKARCLIDTVKKKGDSACMKMIAHLQSRDPILFSELGLSCSPPAPPASGPRNIQEEGWSTTLIPTTEAFWRQKQNNKDIYPVTINNIGSRVALLITNITFKLKRLDRHGAEKDELNTEKLLTDLGYEVVKHTNLTAKAIDDAVIKFSKHPKLRETDSVMVVIMSHGKRGTILGVDWKPRTSDDEEMDEFSIDNIYKHLGSEKCPALLNKPKILIIQACRGGVEVKMRLIGWSERRETQSRGLFSGIIPPELITGSTQPVPRMRHAREQEGHVLVSDDPAVCDDDNKEDCFRIAHSEKDFISLLSCTPDTVSYRNLNLGSYLILFVVDVFNTVACEDDIEELFRKVMHRFEDYCISNKRQMPTKDRCTFTKRFYFYPGLNVV